MKAYYASSMTWTPDEETETTMSDDETMDRVYLYKWLIAMGIDPDGCGVEALNVKQIWTLVNQINDAICTAETRAADEAMAR